MRPFFAITLGAGLAGLFGCASGAPKAPIGLDKRPANTPETIAGLMGPCDHAPVSERPVAVAINGPSMTRPVPAVTTAVPFVISDFSMPAGLRSMSATERAHLVDTARASKAVIILVRGDHLVPSRANWWRLVRRGVEVKRFLVGQGIPRGKVRVFVRSVGAFVVDNGTAQGRARNRRVEIHFSEVDHGQRT